MVIEDKFQAGGMQVRLKNFGNGYGRIEVKDVSPFGTIIGFAAMGTIYGKYTDMAHEFRQRKKHKDPVGIRNTGHEI